MFEKRVNSKREVLNEKLQYRCILHITRSTDRIATHRIDLLPYNKESNAGKRKSSRPCKNPLDSTIQPLKRLIPAPNESSIVFYQHVAEESNSGTTPSPGADTTHQSRSHPSPFGSLTQRGNRLEAASIMSTIPPHCPITCVGRGNSARRVV